MAAAKRMTVLAYAVRGRVIAKYLAQLGLVLGGLVLLPALFALVSGDATMAVRYALTALLLVLLCAPVARLRVAAHMQTNEALLVTAFAFLLAALIPIWPMMSAGLGIADAAFEAVSAITTTGLSTLPSVAGMPRGFLFARAWIQWCGGLGIAILWVALLLNQQLAMRRLVETAGSENIVTTAQVHARRVLAVYVLLTLAGVTLLWLSGVDLFAAVTHVLSAVSTGGFSTYDDSLVGFTVTGRYLLMLVALSGAVSLPLYFKVYRRDLVGALRDQELWALLLLCALVSLLLWLFLINAGASPSSAWHDAIWMGVSAQTTTGFSSLSVADLDNASKLTLIGAMLTGGSVGSTAGGIKILRLIIVLRLIQLILRRAAMPTHALAEPWLGGRRLEAEDFERVLVIMALFIGGVGVSWLVFLVYGYAPLDALFEVVSATGTVGLSTGITRLELELPLKCVLMLDMLLGRLEFVALLVVLWPGTWFGRRDQAL